MRFQVIFTYDSEYKGYVADVPELLGCMSQGKTLDEAIENIKDAITGYLYVERKHNRSLELKEESAFIGEVVV
ncbi:MAG: type II toxin-antitoxin system HicB family antitoxin [Candidatus Methanolliviera hydrocarbonicum]|uniref:Type II toxin-antitoxin system HicB family antitoxin n=1 Tax=Candidatus Methanolliviera hydrocarbonicum TaxID=2491085 RepID=A0A520KVJ5_9EURY|nr:MAG: type II toxin-antitoxin system HicB family antitoxin [Candidatus Methanolliviera hydrocarbonicum]